MRGDRVVAGVVRYRGRPRWQHTWTSGAGAGEAVTAAPATAPDAVPRDAIRTRPQGCLAQPPGRGRPLAYAGAVVLPPP